MKIKGGNLNSLGRELLLATKIGFVSAMFLLLSGNAFSQSHMGGISYEAGVYRIGNCDWLEFSNIEMQTKPFFSQQLGYKGRVFFKNPHWGLDYSLNIQLNEINRFYDNPDSEYIIGYGGLSAPLSLRYGITNGDLYYYTSAGLVMDVSLFKTTKFVHIETSDQYTDGDRRTERSIHDFSLGSQFSIGLIKQINENNSLGLSLNYQLYELMFEQWYRFGSQTNFSENGENDYYYYPMSLRLGVCWYFGDLTSL